MPNSTYYKRPDETVDQYKARNGINSSILQQQESITLPQTPVEQQYDVSAIPTFDQITATQAPTSTEQTQDQLSSRFLTAIQKMGGKVQAQSSAEQQAGLPVLNQQLTDINSQIQTLQNEAKAIPLNIQNEFEGRGATAAGVAPVQAAALRKNAIKALGLSSIASTLQGNIALAQQQANRAVEVEFAPLEAEINYLREAMTLNEKRLNREDSKRTQLMQFRLNERERLLSNAKEDRNIIIGWAAEAAKLGNAPSLVLNNALTETDPRSALAILNPYLVDIDAKQQAYAELEYKRAQTAQTYEQIRLVKANIDIAEANAEKTRQEIEAGRTPTQAAQDRKNEVLTLAQGLRADNAVGKSSAVGASFAKAVPFGQTLGFQGNRSAFEARVDTLKANLTLDNLKLLKGPMSDKDLAFLQAVGSSLNTNMSEAAFNEELDKVILKLNGGTSQPPQIIYQGQRFNVDPATGDLTPA